MVTMMMQCLCLHVCNAHLDDALLITSGDGSIGKKHQIQASLDECVLEQPYHLNGSGCAGCAGSSAVKKHKQVDRRTLARDVQRRHETLPTRQHR